MNNQCPALIENPIAFNAPNGMVLIRHMGNATVCVSILDGEHQCTYTETLCAHQVPEVYDLWNTSGIWKHRECWRMAHAVTATYHKVVLS